MAGFLISIRKDYADSIRPVANILMKRLTNSDFSRAFGWEQKEFAVVIR